MPMFFSDSGSFNSLQVTGSTILSGSANVLTLIGSGSEILVISGSQGPIFSINDNASSTELFAISSGSTDIFTISNQKVISISGSLLVSGSIVGTLTGTVSTASYILGSNVAGNISGNAANITAYTINQNLGTTNQVTFGGITSSLRGTATTASYILGSNVSGNITGNAANITAYTINQNLGTTNQVSFAGVTASLFGNATTASYALNAIITASVSSNTITFTKGDDTTFNLTVNAGSGAPGGSDTEIQFNKTNAFAGTSSFAFIYISQSLQHGNNVKAYGQFSRAEGEQTIALGFASHAEGAYTSASADYSHAEGRETIASGFQSHAEGYGSIASGDYSHAEGFFTIASGLGSHAEGRNTLANNRQSHSEGNLTTASGWYSHTEGYNTQATANYAHASGMGTIASGEGQTTVGKYNISTNSTSLFVVGAGTDDSNRKDAFTVEPDGLSVFTSGLIISGSTSVTGSVIVTGSVNVSGSVVADNTETLIKTTSDVVINAGAANALTNITGLTFDYVSGDEYYFLFYGIFTTDASTTGTRWTLSGTNFAQLAYTSEYTLTATTTTRNTMLSAQQLPAASNATSNVSNGGGNFARIEGMLIANGSGTFQIQGAREVTTGTVTLKAGSFLKYKKLT